ncbi:hypothetical protein PIB30_067710 [Stylosanthes scabra]|uniref:Uncharacterized protein n=1 Tax=Stylosanthes scabra TaxID=79078 RepID=A0ABU6RNS7_9FABA|nr:hypothetical protein [Stylosanthes scabra]
MNCLASWGNSARVLRAVQEVALFGLTPTEKAMIDASSGGALMNKTPKEAWELIETVSDANQHFNRRATSKGLYEVAPSDSTVLAKSLVDIAYMLKEIREG